MEGLFPAPPRGSNCPGGGGKGLCGGGPGGVELGEPSETRRCGRGGLEGGPGSGGASSLRLLRRSPPLSLGESRICGWPEAARPKKNTN